MVIRTAIDAYNHLISKGYPKELARYILPCGVTTELYITANLREWRHIIKLRASKHAQPEMQVLARKILRILLVPCPHVFEDLAPLLDHD